MIGRWIEVTGRLESLDKTGLREVHVRSFRVVPVVPPKVAEAEPVTPPTPEVVPVAPTPELPAVGTTGVAELPKTASSLPTTALFGVFALAAGIALLVFRRRIAG